MSMVPGLPACCFCTRCVAVKLWHEIIVQSEVSLSLHMTVGHEESGLAEMAYSGGRQGAEPASGERDVITVAIHRTAVCR